MRDSSDNNNCPETVFRRYIIRDNDGFSGYCDQLIILRDTVKPVFAGTLPPKTVEAGGQGIPYTVSDLVRIAGLSDNCGLDMNYISYSTDQLPGCPEKWVYHYEVRDLCDNRATINQVFIMYDKIIMSSWPPPQYLCKLPPPYPADFFKGKVRSYLGAEITIQYRDKVVSGSGCNKTVERTYTFTTACAQPFTWTDKIFLSDKEPPVFVKLPPAKTVECSFIPAYRTYKEFRNAGGEVFDNCDRTDTATFKMINKGDTISLCPMKIVRSYTIADSCGLWALPFKDTLTITDKKPPVADKMRNLGPYNCYADIPVAHRDSVKGVSDDCGGKVKVEWISDTPDPGCYRNGHPHVPAD